MRFLKNVAASLVLSCRLFGQAAPAGQVTGVGNFIHVVSNLDKSIQFYRDSIGLELNGDPGPRPYVMNAPVSTLYDAPGQLRFAVLKVPASDMNVEIVEFKDVNSKPARPRLQDPGATILILTVRDIDAILTRLKKGPGQVVTLGGEPVTMTGNGGTTRVVFVKDPDNFYVELVQRDPAPITAAPASSNVIGISFGITVEDTEKTMRFYRETLGFQPQVGASFRADKTRMDVAGTPGAQYRRSTAMIPGTSFEMEFLEFKGIDRQAQHPTIHDPGAPVLRLRVHDMDAFVKALNAAGAPLVTTAGEIVKIGKSRVTMARELNNLFLEPLQSEP
jgi:catechol 2,3-dioxygenase-like lactoylglutathione lyase family enzyme